MNLDPVTLGHILVVLARLLEMFSFGVVLLFIFRGIAVKYVFITAGLTVGGILLSIFGYLGGYLSPFTSFGIDAVVFFAVVGTAFYAFMEKREKKIMPPPPPSKGVRCPVCGAFVKPEDEYAVAREGNDLLYFDTLEHLLSFLENFQEYKRLKRLNFRKIEDVFCKRGKAWVGVD
ncbi:MAG: hypothetical protein RMH93_06830 [Aquificaceae bacterium]|nr:hypothetical protein [Aquificaceae bacterium]MDW8033245.1 hypothetical protein [Aquificaceae bacterium]MDW8294775.1 hypothetical protein [Aquificaceae bacterium]